jgi:drug/metabolite transporter (DMT)-like permease
LAISLTGATRASAASVTRRNDPVLGVAWIVSSMVLMSAMAAMARWLSKGGMHPFEIMFFRNICALIVMLPLLAWQGRELFRSNQIKLYGARSMLSLFSMGTWFYALSMIPLGELTAISFLGPLFGTIGAVLFLGEVVRLRRWTALFIGFLGAMLILRPNGASFGVGQSLALLSAMSGGIVALLIKQLTSEDKADKIVFLTTLIMTPFSALPALFVWQWPALSTVPMLFGMGLCAVLAHIMLVRGYTVTDVSLAQTFEFSRLPFAVTFGYLIFGEIIDGWVWIGAAIIFASAVYITRREVQLKRRPTGTKAIAGS